MRLISFYFFLILCIGFFFIYIFKNDFIIVSRDKRNPICINGSCNL